MSFYLRPVTGFKGVCRKMLYAGRELNEFKNNYGTRTKARPLTGRREKDTIKSTKENIVSYIN
jgi:hypothetical protein